jgi:plastocyanin
MSAALLAAGALLLAGGHGDPMAPTPAPVAGTGPVVTMQGQSYTPRDLVVLVGETVTWSNEDSLAHTVTDSDDDRFDSGSIVPGHTFAHVFAEQGVFPYHCTIHRFMFGIVRVYGVSLDAPAAVRPGALARLSGRVPAGAGPVVLEQRQGDAFVEAGHADPAPDGSYTISVPVAEPAVYRVRAGDLTSQTVVVRVQPAVRATATRAGALVRVVARVDPPRPGAVGILQRYVRERFTWQTVGHARMGPGGTVRLSLRARDEVYVRVLAARLGGGWAVGASPSVRVRALR